jgi:hypothetical protein
MPSNLQPPPDPDPDTAVPSTPEPYWRRELWRPAAYADSVGLFVDLGRRLMTRTLGLQWRLHLDARIRAEVYACDEYTARAAVRGAMYDYDTVVALSRADFDAVPPWRPLGTATDVGLCTDVFCVCAEGGVWRCVARMTAIFTVDVTDAAWPQCYFAVDIVAAPQEQHLAAIEVDGVHIAHRRPTR